MACQRARSPSHRAAPSCQCAAVCRPHVRFCTCSFRGSLETDRGEIGSMPHIDLVRRFHGRHREALLKSRSRRTDECSMGTNLLLHGMRVASRNDLKSYRLPETYLQTMPTDGASVIPHEPKTARIRKHVQSKWRGESKYDTSHASHHDRSSPRSSPKRNYNESEKLQSSLASIAQKSKPRPTKTARQRRRRRRRRR